MTSHSSFHVRWASIRKLQSIQWTVGNHRVQKHVRVGNREQVTRETLTLNKITTQPHTLSPCLNSRASTMSNYWLEFSDGGSPDMEGAVGSHWWVREQAHWQCQHEGCEEMVRRKWLACTEIILHVETWPTPTHPFWWPKDIWTNLEKIHHACGFVTCLSLQQCFLSITKDTAKPMSHW